MKWKPTSEQLLEKRFTICLFIIETGTVGVGTLRKEQLKQTETRKSSLCWLQYYRNFLATLADYT